MSEIDVAVNLMWMSPGRVGGSEQYLTRQLTGLDTTGLQLTLHADPTFAGAHPGLAARFDIDAVPGIASGRAARIVAEHTWLAARTRHADVVHHGGGTAPLVGNRRIVLTIHDLQYLVHPQYFGAVRRRYLDVLMPRSARRAAVVAVPSEAVRAHVIEAFGIDAERVVVVPHGVPEMTTPSDDDLRAVRARHGLGDRPYVLYPAITHPHKRHALVIDMLDHLDPTDHTVLVLIGGPGDAEVSVRDAIETSPNRSRVVRPGRVSDADRDALVAGADALVFPSEFEGFGAPLIEAMALRTPVVCSDASAVTEVVGDAAVVVREPAGEAWAEALATARCRHDELVELGRRRRTAFTIERSGQAIADAYRQAATS